MHRISLSNTVFEGENNAYLFTDGPTTLVDTGVSDPDTRAQLRQGLSELGVAFDDVERIFLTHYHADHAGLVGEIQQASGATVYAHAADAALVAGDDDAWEEQFEQYRSLFDEWNMPTEKQRELLAYLSNAQSGYGDPATVESFVDGNEFDVGGHTMEVLHAPGHTAGQSCFVFDDEVLTGDAILPVYTPNVGGADVRVEAPLAKYLQTLNRIADREFQRAWPGHRDPIDDPTVRAEHIIHHHEERALRILRVLSETGPADTWTVSAELFGDLVEIHVLHGPGESSAHLEHLVASGAVQRVDSGYELTSETEDRLSTHDSDRWPL